MNEKERSRRIRAAADEEEEEEYEEREREKEERPRRRKVNLSKEDPGRSKVKDDGASMEKMMENQLMMAMDKIFDIFPILVIFRYVSSFIRN